MLGGFFDFLFKFFKSPKKNENKITEASTKLFPTSTAITKTTFTTDTVPAQSNVSDVTTNEVSKTENEKLADKGTTDGTTKIFEHKVKTTDEISKTAEISTKVAEPTTAHRLLFS